MKQFVVLTNNLDWIGVSKGCIIEFGNIGRFILGQGAVKELSIKESNSGEFMIDICLRTHPDWFMEIPEKRLPEKNTKMQQIVNILLRYIQAIELTYNPAREHYLFITKQDFEGVSKHDFILDSSGKYKNGVWFKLANHAFCIRHDIQEGIVCVPKT